MSTPPLPAADWSDPKGEPGHKHGNGEHWHADVPATAPPADQQPPSTPVSPTQSPITTEGQSRQEKIGFFVGGLVVLVIVVQVKWALIIGAWFPGLLVSIAIAIFGVTFVVRSGQSGACKAMFVIVLVLACFTAPVASWMTGLVP